MDFLNIGLLGLLAPFILVPLLIHLFNRKFPKRIVFSSIEFIKRTQSQRSKLMRFRHLIMTTLRTIMVVMLALAFLKPLLDQFGASREQVAATAARDTLIVFDHSLSMEHRANLVPARKRALLEADKIISSLEAGQNLNAIAVGRDARSCFFDFSGQHDAVLSFLNSLPPGIQTANYEKAIAQAARLMEKSNNRASGADVYFITDFQRENWANAKFDQLPESARLFFVDVGEPNRKNRAVLGVEVSPSPILAGEPIELQVKIGNYTDEVLSDVPIEVILDYTNAVDAKVSCSAWSQTSLTLGMKAPSPGTHTIEIKLPQDDLVEDDNFHLTLPVLDKEEVVIVSDRLDTSSGAPHYVRTAVNPYRDLDGSLLPKLIRSSDLDAASLSTTSKLILLELGAITETNSLALIDYLEKGGGAIWFLDSENDLLNTRSINTFLDSPLPIRLIDWQTPSSLPDGFQRLGRGNFKSDFLRLFRGSNRQNLGLLHFTRYRRATASNDTSVILSFADGTPALATTNIGLGTLLVANFSIDEAHSNLARQRSFPAWLQDMVKHIAVSDSDQLYHEAGTEVATKLWRTEIQDLILKNPSGDPIEYHAVRDGELAYVNFKATEPGFYRMSGNGENLKRVFAVNPSPNESDLRLMDKQRLPLRANSKPNSNGAEDPAKEASQPNDRAHFVSGTDDYQAIQSGTEIFHWFLLALCALMVIEMLLQLLFRRAAG